MYRSTSTWAEWTAWTSCWGIMNIGVINAQILWTLCNRPLPANERLFSLKSFKMKLIRNLADDFRMNIAVIRLANTYCGKTLNEMNCHLHPLDPFTTSCRSVLKSLEDTTGNVFGKRLLTANWVLGLNKLRYKDGKRDPRGIVTFLDRSNLPRGTKVPSKSSTHPFPQCSDSDWTP